MAGIAGSLVSAWALRRFGFRRAIWPLTLAMNLNIWVYVWLASAHPDPHTAAGLGTIASAPLNSGNGQHDLVLASTSSGLGSSITVTAPAADSAVTVLGLASAVANGAYHGTAATATQTLDSIASSIQTAIGAGNATVSVSPTNQIQIKAATAGQGHSIEILNGTANAAQNCIDRHLAQADNGRPQRRPGLSQGIGLVRVA